MAKTGNTSITVPDEIVDRIEHFLKTNDWGFKSRPEVVKVAIAEFLLSRGRGLSEVCNECGGGLAGIEDGDKLWRGILHRPSCALLKNMVVTRADRVVDAPKADKPRSKK